MLFKKITNIKLVSVIALTLFEIVCISLASGSEADVQRTNFSLAMNALENGDYGTFINLSEQNKNYILYPYLKFYDLRHRIARVNVKEINNFIDKYGDTPLKYRLSKIWLRELGKMNRWRDYLGSYEGQKDVVLQCYFFRAQLILENDVRNNRAILEKVKKLWLVGKTQPKECIPLFKKLYASALIDTNILWKRVELAMERGNLELASHLAKKFGKKDQNLIALWKRVYKNPEKGIHLRQLKSTSVIKRKIIYQAIKKVASRDAIKANQYWSKIIKIHRYSQKQKGEMQRHIALNAAYDFFPQALSMLDNVAPEYENDNVRKWRAKVALRQSQWQELINRINALHNKEKNKYKWRYWMARAKYSIGQDGEALSIYQSLASKTNYYGFLAADKLGKSYIFNSNPIKRDNDKLQKLEKLPGVRRTKELYLLDRTTDARREWNLVISQLNNSDTMLAAVLAHNWQWHDNAIYTVARTDHREDLDLRFPTPYRDLILINAQTMAIDPSWVYGVARRESAFKKDARSSKGAIGLMQILPTTARLQSKKLGLRRPSIRDIFATEHNILLGSSYLNSMLHRFLGNQVLATAAYNAGPNRVDAWLEKSNNISADIWIDTLPYRETRQYVRAVMAYTTIFDWKLKDTTTPLKLRMQPISYKYAMRKNY